MAFSFPASPATNDTYTVGSRTYTWTGSVWEMTGGLITTSQLTDLGVTTGKIDNLAITAGKLASDAVTTAKILDANVTAGKLASGAAVTNIGYTPANIAGPTFTGTVVLPSTTSIGTVTSTEIGYVDGVTSAIQTQLDSKITATTDVTSNRNVVINGNMAVWQRGTSFADSAFGLTVDRWEAGRGGFASGLTVSRQTGPTNFQYCARVQRASGNTSTQNIRFATTLETVNSLPLAGKTVTVSFYARAGANFSTSSSQIEVFLRSGTTTDAVRIGAGDTFATGAATPASLTQPLTTSWQRFSVSGSVASTATQLALIVYASPTGTAGANDWYEITGVQLEAGAVATPFEFEDFGTTLNKCQRYYQKSYAYATVPASAGGIQQGLVFAGSYNAASQGHNVGQITFQTALRAAPTVTIYGYSPATAGVVSNVQGTNLAAGSGTAQFANEYGAHVYNNSGGTITPNLGGYMFHFVASAEL